MKNISIALYTHSNVKDAWPMFFGELKKYMPDINVNVFCDIMDSPPFSDEHHFIQYDDPGPFYKQYCDCLKQVKTDFILTLFEDQILYGDVDDRDINRFMYFLRTSEYDFLRLVKSDVHEEILIKDDIFLVPPKQHYFFSFQPTIWKRESMIKVLEDSKIESIFSERSVGEHLRNLGMSGTYVYNGEQQIGRQHCESSTFPCMEVIARGKWITKYYGKELGELFKKYNINPSIRGET